MGQPYFINETDGNGIVRTYSVLEGIICAPNGVEIWRTLSTGTLSGSHGLVAGSGVAKITVSADAPVNPSIGDLWVDT